MLALLIERSLMIVCSAVSLLLTLSASDAASPDISPCAIARHMLAPAASLRSACAEPPGPPAPIPSLASSGSRRSARVV
jgi:hypothetical protein